MNKIFTTRRCKIDSSVDEDTERYVCRDTRTGPEMCRVLRCGVLNTGYGVCWLVFNTADTADGHTGGSVCW